MATFRKRNGKWQVQVRRKDEVPVTQTFLARKDADAWAREVERKLDRGETLVEPPAAVVPTLGELLQRYLAQVTPRKRSATVEFYRIGKLQRHTIAKVRADKLTAAVVADYRDDRLLEVSGETVRQDLVLMRQVLDTARREWGIDLKANPVLDVRKPAPAKPRQRRLKYGDVKALLAASRSLRSVVAKDLFRFALATGMRRGEILRLTWSDIDLDRRVLTIPITKNGHARTIPLSPHAVSQLRRLSQAGLKSGPVFPITETAFRLAWQRVKKRAGLVDFRFHDLRHEAVSRFFEIGLSLPEVALISGHRDPRQLETRKNSRSIDAIVIH